MSECFQDPADRINMSLKSITTVSITLLIHAFSDTRIRTKNTMATLESLKKALQDQVTATELSQALPLSDSQDDAGLDIFVDGSVTQDFVIPQLSLLFAELAQSRVQLSALEVRPGPRSVLGYLPALLRRSIRKYTAFEPNERSAARLDEWFGSTPETESPLPCLEKPPDIHRTLFARGSNAKNRANSTVMNAANTIDGAEKFDIILCCESLYDSEPKQWHVEQALETLAERPGAGVVVFHRDNDPCLDNLACHRTVAFPTGVVLVEDEEEKLGSFAASIAGFALEDADADKALRIVWRRVCRDMGRREEHRPSYLLFSSPSNMTIFTRHATALPELTAEVPSIAGKSKVQNRPARLRQPAALLRPENIAHVQRCVRWALSHNVGLTVVGGGHSGHCVCPNVAAIDMAAFDKVHIVRDEETASGSGFLVVAEAGCKSGDIVRETMAMGLTVPLGAHPGIGVGSWLQGGIGHLARLHGLTCDAIVGAVLVSVASGRVFHIGRVPTQHRPVDAVQPENEADLLWAIKGAGTNFGVIVSVIFTAYPAPVFMIRNWVIPLRDNCEARSRLRDFDTCVVGRSPRNCSVDAYIYWDADKLHLGVTMFDARTPPTHMCETPTQTSTFVTQILGQEHSCKTADCLSLLATDVHLPAMPVGRRGENTTSFKRCILLKRLGASHVANVVLAAIGTRPSPLCFLHFVQGGGAVSDVPAEAAAFGSRDWDWACVVTGVWSSADDGTVAARAAIRWVYTVAKKLLTVGDGAYGADLGPDPRDRALADEAFGLNQRRLARLKRDFDPQNVLRYASPLGEAATAQRLIILVTGESCAGKDYCADTWVSQFRSYKNLTAQAVSISEVTKREYAAAAGTDLNRLLQDRAYKELHRPALTVLFQDQLRQHPALLEERFLAVVRDAADVDVLLITGMRDMAPVATFAHLVSNCRLIEVNVRASQETLRARGRCYDNNDVDNQAPNGRMNLRNQDYRATLVFDNSSAGTASAKRFAEARLLSLCHEDFHRLANLIRPVPDFPRPGINFRHVLDISQQPGGLHLCTSLLQTQFAGDWAKVDAIACCEAGGFVFASAVALQVDIPLALIREAGKVPPPTISAMKSSSHISSSTTNELEAKAIEMSVDVIPKGAHMVVVDDVLATGETLCAVLGLLNKAGVDPEDVDVMIVAEFPQHRGRELLRRRGFGRARIQSLLVFNGV